VSTDANNVTDPTWTCSIDGIEIPSPDPTFQFPENNWKLCAQNTIASGAHVLTVQVTSKGQAFYFDRMVYTPPPDAVFPSAVLVYPPSDPAISFSAGWNNTGGPYVTQTTNARVTLNFQGALLVQIYPARLGTQPPFQERPPAFSGRPITNILSTPRLPATPSTAGRL
jgi:hypothetical protein